MKITAMGIAAAGLAWLLGLHSLPASAAGDDPAAHIRSLEEKLERSLQMIDALQRRVQQLEAADADAKKAPPPDQAAKLDALEQQVSQLSSGLALRQPDSGVPLHGFADIGLRYSGENNRYFGKGNKGFNVGSFDLYLTPRFGDHVRMLIEPNIEANAAGETNVDMERLQIGYVFNDYLTGWAGRFHTPYGYWNTAFHHGAQIQTSVLRPRFLEFEDRGGILPAHTTGAWFTGATPASAGKVGYDAFVGNSQRIKTDPANLGPDSIVPTGTLDTKMGGSGSANSVAGFNAWYTPARMGGLRVGLHGLGGTIAAVDAANSILAQTRVRVAGGYLAFADDDWEVMSEYYRFTNRDITGATGSHRSSAWYAQVGRNWGLWTPYGRFEKANLDQADSYFAYQTYGRSYTRGAVGLRYDIDPKAALKLELSRTAQRDLVDRATAIPVADDRYNMLLIQYAVRF